MKNNLAKAISTVVMWLVLGTVSMAGAINASLITGPNQSWIVVGPLVIALAGTFILWVLSPSGEGTSPQVNAEKAKRQSGDKLALLMELMDEDERATFKETLKRRILEEPTIDSEGEIVYGPDSLEGLFDDEPHKRLRQ